MKKIEILLDDYLIKKKDREDLVNLFSKVKNKKITECDTHAKGGLAWFPVDLVITAIGLTATGFLQEMGKDIYLKLKKKIKKLTRSERGDWTVYVNIAFEIKNKIIYFTFSEAIIERDFDEAFDKIFSDFNETAKKIEKFINSNPENLFGYYESITMQYDFEEKRWIVGWLNKNKS